MQNFTFHTPTKVFFGKGTEKQVGEIIKSYGFSKVLFHYGSGSIKKSGLYDVVVASLKENGIDYVELGGVEANPKLSLARKAAELAKSEKVDMILAVGGGSVLDSAKAAAAGAYYGCDPWEFSSKKRVPEKALPVGTILTLAASGSEMSDSCVITNEDGWLKRGFNAPSNRPLFSIMNPELTFTVSKYQTGCGIVDIMMHTLERYFSLNEDNPLTDAMSEGLLKTVVEAGRRAIENPEDYEARATLMWAGSLSHNGLTGCGKQFMMRCHQLEHELSGAYDRVAHGAGLAVIFPAWAKYICTHNISRFAQYAVNVWGIPMNFEHPERTALAGIEATEQYFRSIGMPVRLSELGIDDSRFEEMAEKCTFFGKRTLPDYIEIGKKEMLDIYRLCL
ncbi:MAG TPA: iron-containing alcohol dehydrogenase [Candidatus Merdivicinus intestinavium]|nr:iron-containing alcohol dehydrogenase [Candidatus Merdivicinus intestinavium]